MGKSRVKGPLAGAVLAGLLNACCGKTVPPAPLDVRTHDVLVTRAEIQALHDPPRTTVETREIRPGAGSQICEKVGGAACTIGGVLSLGILPLFFALTDAPPYDELVVRTENETLYIANLDKNGRFMSALDRRSGEARQIGVVDIPKLAKFAIVERARGPLAKAGSKSPDGPFTPTLLSTQYDVAGECEPALPKHLEGGDRGELIAQCAAALRGEADPFLGNAFAASNVDTQASTLSFLCRRGASEEARDLALARFPSPGPQLARAGAACRHAGPKILPYLRAIASEACTAPPAELPKLLAFVDRREVRTDDLQRVLPEAAPTCGDPIRTALIAAVLSQTKNPAPLAGALSGDDPGIPAFVAVLDENDKMVRKAMLMALSASPHAESVAKKLAPLAYHPPDEQLLIGLGFAKNPRLGARAALLPKLRALGFASSGLRPIVEAEAKAAAGSDDRVALRVGMIVAGRREHAANVAAALSGYEGATEASLSALDAGERLPAFVAQGLSLAGCHDAQIAALVKEPKAPDGKRGALCTQPR